jgi:hypothetical protein
MVADFKIKISKDGARMLRKILDRAADASPFEPPEEWSMLGIQVNEIMDLGCSKHGILCTRFRTGRNETHTICPECAPKEYAEMREQGMPEE